MSTMTVRIHEDTHRSLKDLAQQTGEAMADILATAIEEYRRQHFLKGLAADFAALRRDPAAWEEELREREAWDTTLGDGLEGD
jgi:predicted transcriptional regulator